MSIGERIREFRKSKGLSMSEFGEKIYLSSQAVSLIELGNREPTDRVVDSICREYGINKVWLRTGEGPMTPPDLDPRAAVIAKMMKDDNEHPFYDLIFATMMAFQAMDPISQKTFENILLETLSKYKKNDPE